MKSFSPILTLFALSLLFSLAQSCGQRSSDSPTLGNSGLTLPATTQNVQSDRSAELEKLILDQSAALDKLSLDKSSLEEQALALDAQIKALNIELTTSKALTEQQKIDMQKQIADLTAQKAALDKTILDLNTKNADLQKQLDAAKAANIQLQKDLEAAKQVAAQQAAAANTPPVPTTANFYSFRFADPANVKRDCIDVTGASTAEFASVFAYPCGTASLNQQFAVQNPANQFFQIKARHSGKCLIASELTEGAYVFQKTCTTDLKNNWEFFTRGQANFRLRSQFSGKCMKIQADGRIVLGNCETNATYFSWSVAG